MFEIHENYEVCFVFGKIGNWDMKDEFIKSTNWTFVTKEQYELLCEGVKIYNKRSHDTGMRLEMLLKVQDSQIFISFDEIYRELELISKKAEEDLQKRKEKVQKRKATMEAKKAEKERAKLEELKKKYE